MRGLGIQVVDLSADFRLVDAAIYERWYGPHGEPELLENAVYGLTELDRERDPRRRAGRQPGLLSDRRAARAGAAGRARPDRLGDRRRQVGRLGRRARRGRARSLVQPDRERRPLRRPTATATCPRSSRSCRRLGADVDGRRFVPHLLPIDQGLLASCYVELTEPVEGIADAVRGALRRRAVRRGRRDAAGRARGPRHEPLPDLRRARSASAARSCFAAIDNLWKGAAGQAIQNLNLMLGFEETEGLLMTASSSASRWVRGPAGRRGARPGAAGARLPRRRRSPAGSRAAARPTSACSPATRERSSSALLLTRNAAAAAPVRVCRDDCDAGAIRAAVVNSGNANAATGERGYPRRARDARRRGARDRRRAARGRGRRDRRDRGAAGDRRRASRGVERAAAELSAAGGARVRARRS